jgi:hypothetical protein
MSSAALALSGREAVVDEHLARTPDHRRRCDRERAALSNPPQVADERVPVALDRAGRDRERALRLRDVVVPEARLGRRLKPSPRDADASSSSRSAPSSSRKGQTKM